ncbi:MAG: hypothetical protein C3F02_04665 [Parcubacteria group bacterium]|nr:MAG: hypothetical protein C3F02_04665 [Parcubacteria group bacterium]
MPGFYTPMKKNRLLYYLLFFLLAEICSWLAYNFIFINFYVLAGLFILGFVLVFWKPEYALYLSLAELFWGGAGHSFIWAGISARMIIFAAIVSAFAIKYCAKLPQLKLVKDKNFFRLWLFLITIIALAIIVGIYNKYPWADIFLDANAYFYVLYLPVWYEFYQRDYLKNIYQLLLAAVLIISVKTITIFNVYAQYYHSTNLTFLYKWVRDSRSGEITPFTVNFWRVFMSAQIYVLFAFVVLFLKQFFGNKKYGLIFYLAIFIAALYISLSRSFWLGVVVAGTLLSVNYIIFRRHIYSWKIWLRLIPVFILGFLFVELAYNLPHWNSWQIFGQRSTDSGEAAASSRLQLLPVMGQAIKNSPLIGYGFGKELTYRSNDPRIKSGDNPEGWLTTYSFEWGWLDQWVKGGVLLVACFVAWILLVLKRAYGRIREQYIKPMAIISILGAVAVIHIFSPYLNHPLGLGALMLSTIIFGHEH